MRPSPLACLLIVSAFPQSASALDVGKTLRNLGDAASDIITLGGHGRERDRARAEAREREAQLKRQAEERAKQDKIKSLQEAAATYERVLKDFDYFTEYAKLTSLELNALSKAASRQLGERSWWQRYGMPAWISAMKDDQSYGEAVLAELEALSLAREEITATPKDDRAAEDVREETQRYENNRQGLQRAQKAIVNLKQLAKNAGIETEILIAESLSRTDTEDAELLVRKLSELDHNLLEMTQYTAKRRDFYASELKNLQARLSALTAPPLAPAPAPAPPAKPIPLRNNVQEYFRRSITY